MAARKSSPTTEHPLRFAHPFFTATPPEQRARMTDHIESRLRPIPPIKGDGLMTLADVIGKSGADAIAATNQITIQVCGDTGVREADRETRQVMVAEAMSKAYKAHQPELSPAFFMHLGDVIYGPGSIAYLEQYYRPYMHYPGKIIAIPGNHDGETDQKMTAFRGNFCAATQKIPAIAGTIYRETMTQPGVYWCLDAPFVQIIGLYSNCAENPGYIAGPTIGQSQKKWLVKTLKTIRKARAQGMRKALLIATHHPPYSSGGHSGSHQMLADIDDACTQANIMPDAFFSGHAHSIQRYTRTVSFGGKKLKIPYLVSGCGGHGGQTISKQTRQPDTNPVYEFGYQGWGYCTVRITSHDMSITSHGIDWNSANVVDQVTVPLH